MRVIYMKPSSFGAQRRAAVADSGGRVFKSGGDPQPHQALRHRRIAPGLRRCTAQRLQRWVGGVILGLSTACWLLANVVGIATALPPLVCAGPALDSNGGCLDAAAIGCMPGISPCLRRPIPADSRESILVPLREALSNGIASSRDCRSFDGLGEACWIGLQSRRNNRRIVRAMREELQRSPLT